MFDEILGLTVYGPYTRTSDLRKYMTVVRVDGRKSTMSYPKWLAMHLLNRVLDDDETVDHIDRDKTNDDLNNLRVVKNSKHVADDADRAEPVLIECVRCGQRAYKKARYLRRNSKMGKAGPFCNRSCSGKYSRSVQLGKMDRLPTQPSPKTHLTFIQKDVQYEDTLAYSNRQRSNA